jgi:hypothetical protein
VLKVSARAFGRGRPMPIVMKQSWLREPEGRKGQRVKESEGQATKRLSD